MYKPRWGAFYNTSLEQLLRSERVTTVVVAGCNFANCPRTTMCEACERDYRVAFVTGACSQVYERGETELTRIGVRRLPVDDCVREVLETHARWQ